MRVTGREMRELRRRAFWQSAVPAHEALEGQQPVSWRVRFVRWLLRRAG